MTRLPRLVTLVSPAGVARFVKGRLPRIPSQTSSSPAPSPTAVADSFNRPDETPLSFTDTGQPWTAFAGTGLSVITNRLGKVTVGTQGSVVDTGFADGTVGFTAAVATWGSGDYLVMRAVDTSNYLRLRLISGDIQQVVAGVNTGIGAMADAVQAGDAITFVFGGGNVSARRNGVEEAAVVTTLLTGSKFGFQLSGVGGRVDDLSVTP